MDPLSISASAAGLLTLVVQLASYADTIKNARKERAAFLAEMKTLQPLLIRLERHAVSTSPWASSATEISAILVLLRKTLLEVEKELKPAEGFRRLTHRMLWIIEKPKFQERVSDIGRYIQQIKYYVSEDHYDTSVNTNAVVREISDDSKEGLTLIHGITTATKDSNIRVQRIQSISEETQFAVHEIKSDGKENYAMMTDLSEGMKMLKLREQEKKAEEERQERKGIAEWLSPYKFLAKQKDLRDNSHALGQWLLQHEVYQAWLGGRWWQLRLYGDAGAGKTRLCSIIVDHLQHSFTASEIPVICMYLEAPKDVSRNQHHADLLGGLLKQLIQQKESDIAPEDLREAYRKNTAISARLSVDEIKKFLLKELERYERVILVVDALDECGEATQIFLEYLFDELQMANQMNVSIMVTVRGSLKPGAHINCSACGEKWLALYWRCEQCPQDPGYDLCERCHGAGVTCGNPDHNLVEPNSRIELQVVTPPDELREFVKCEIGNEIGVDNQRDARLYQHRSSTSFGARLAANSKLRDEVAEKIVQRADGKFIFAKLYWESLKKRRTTEDIIDALGNFPDSIEQLYEDAMRDRILKQDTDENSKLAVRILSILCYAKQNLNLPELLHALATRKGDTEFCDLRDYHIQEILDVTKGFVTIGSDADPDVRFFHATFHVYLLNTRDRWFPNGEKEMAEICLTYMSFKGLKVQYRNIREFEAKKQQYPLLPYASQYWGEHARNAGTGSDPELEGMVFDYVKSADLATACMRAAWCGQTEASTQWDFPKSVNGLHICAWFGLSDAIIKMVKEVEDFDVDFREIDSKQTPLMWACKRGHVDVVRQLLELGADVNAKDIKGRTPMFEAIQSNSQEVVHTLLERDKLDINAANPKDSNKTALWLACRLGHTEIARSLLARPTIKVNQQDSLGYTALSVATIYQRNAIVDELIARPEIDLNMVDHNAGLTALALAAERNDTVAVQQLLSRGADASIRDRRGGGMAILRAVERGNLAVLETMLTYKDKVDLFCTDDDGRTLLHGACSSIYVDTDVVKLLIQSGININVTDKNGCTPLHEASQNDIYTAVDFLLDENADPDIKDNFGRTPFVVALQYRRTVVMDLIETALVRKHGPEVSKALYPQELKSLPIWALVNQEREDLIDEFIASNPSSLTEKEPITMETALHRAVAIGNVEILEKLLPYIPANDADRYGRTPLHAAANSNNPTAATAAAVLVQHHVEVNRLDTWGYSPLVLAQSYHYFKVAVVLIEAGADLKAPRLNIQKLFFAAVELESPVAVKKLIHQGANVMVKNEQGRTALQIAKDTNNWEIMQIVKSSKTFFRDPADEVGATGKMPLEANQIFHSPFLTTAEGTQSPTLLAAPSFAAATGDLLDLESVAADSKPISGLIGKNGAKKFAFVKKKIAERRAKKAAKSKKVTEKQKAVSKIPKRRERRAKAEAKFLTQIPFPTRKAKGHVLTLLTFAVLQDYPTEVAAQLQVNERLNAHGHQIAENERELQMLRDTVMEQQKELMMRRAQMNSYRRIERDVRSVGRQDHDGASGCGGVK